jgi:hypothetical protein
MRPLLPAAALHHLGDESTRQAFLNVFKQLVINIPGEPWAKTEEILKGHGML